MPNERLQTIRNNVMQLMGQRKAHERLLEESKSTLKNLVIESKNIAEAARVIRVVAEATQRQLQFQISELASMAEAAVFPEPYKVVVEFTQRRGQTEADVFFERDGLRVEPLEESGHGASDIASFALRISMWLLSTNRTRNVFIFDEPFKNLNGSELQESMWKMVKSISRRLGVQFIIITQFHGLEDIADRVFTVKLKNGVSVVERRDAVKRKLLSKN